MAVEGFEPSILYGACLYSLIGAPPLRIPIPLHTAKYLCFCTYPKIYPVPYRLAIALNLFYISAKINLAVFIKTYLINRKIIFMVSF